MSTSIELPRLPVVPEVKERFLRLPDVLGTCGLGKTTLYRHIQDGAFPKPYKLGARASGWKLSEIQAWADARKQGGVK